MAVNLSPVYGVGGQLFDDNGNPLAGGKIYTYAAGTTTPAATYTSAGGGIPHSNPIVLDGAGRVPSGEIWLTDGIAYKFVVEDSASALIGTYDNLVGINSNFVNFTNSQEIQTATAGQTVFNLTTMTYQPGTNSLSVFVDGVNQYGPGASYAYVETDIDTVTFVSGLHIGASVKFTTSQLNTSGAVDAEQVSYNPPFVDAVATNVEAKLAQSVSVWDFIPAGTNTLTTDCSTYFQNAIDYLVATGESGALNVPAGTYKLDSGLTIDASVCTLKGDAALLDFSSFGVSTGAAITFTGASINYVGNPYFNGVNVMQGFKIQGPGQAVAGNIGVEFTGSGFLGSNDYAMRDCEVFSFEKGIVLGDVAYHLLFDHCSVFLCGVGVTAQKFTNAGARNVFHRCTIFNNDYGFALYNSSSGSTDITDCVIAGISTVAILITGGHLSVTNCDFEPGGSHGALYRTLWVTDLEYPSYSYINWHGNQVSVKNATTVPIYGIDGAAILTMTGGYLYANPSCTGGVFGSVGTGSGQISTFNWSSDYGTNPVTDYNGATIQSYLHFAFTNNISAIDTDVGFNVVEGYGGVISRTGVYGNNNNSKTVSALTTFTSIGVATANGLLVVRDGTLGGMGLFLCDGSSGVVTVSNAVTGLTVSYSGGQLGFTLGSGAVPRTLRWSMLQTATV